MVLFFMMVRLCSRFGLSLALTHAIGSGDSLMFVIERVNPDPGTFGVALARAAAPGA